jgi:hypothetical protein
VSNCGRQHHQINGLDKNTRKEKDQIVKMKKKKQMTKEQTKISLYVPSSPIAGIPSDCLFFPITKTIREEKCTMATHQMSSPRLLLELPARVATMDKNSG